MTQIKQNNILRGPFWLESVSDIPDNKSLKLAILDLEFSYNSDLPAEDPAQTGKGKKLVSELFEKAGTGFSVYKNTLFVLAMEDNQYPTLSDSLKRFLALTEIQNDKGFFETLAKESQDELRKKLKDAEKDMPSKILTAYRHLALLDEKGLDWKDLGIPTVGTSVTISEHVKQYLKDHERFLSRLTPKYIIDKTFARDENEKVLRNIYELFLKTPGMPLLENENVLFEAVKNGVRSGDIGVKEDLEVYYRQDVSPTMDSVILRGETAKQIKEAEARDEIKEEKEEGKEIKEEGIIKKLTLRAKIPWDKLSEIIKGVI